MLVRIHFLEIVQLIHVQDFFSPTECKAFVKFIDDLPLELTPPKRRGEANRVNRKDLHSFLHHVFVHEIDLSTQIAFL
jgi:hypothetical protein